MSALREDGRDQHHFQTFRHPLSHHAKGVPLSVQTAIGIHTGRHSCSRDRRQRIQTRHCSNLSPYGKTTRSTSNKLIDTQTKISNASSTLNDASANSIVKTTLVTTRLDKIQKSMDTLTTQVPKETTKQGGYKAVLLSGGDPENSNLQNIQRAARDAIKARQILIDITPDSPLAPGKVSHAQLVDKIKQALKTIQRTPLPS